MRSFLIKLPLLLLFSLSALSCPKDVPSSSQDEEPVPAVDPPLMRVFMPRTEVSKTDFPSSDMASTCRVDGIVELY